MFLTHFLEFDHVEVSIRKIYHKFLEVSLVIIDFKTTKLTY